MSRQVELDKPLSREDREYLENRGRRHLIIQNDRRFGRDGGTGDADLAPQGPNGGAADEDEDDEAALAEWENTVDTMTVNELRAELQRRSLSTSGNKDELQERLIEAGPRKN